jgi:hypothetical protein
MLEVCTLTVELSDRDGSATVVATTWNVPVPDGAVYRPPESMLPPAAPSCTDQVTAVDWPLTVPVTVAVKDIVPPGLTEALPGETETAITAEAVTVTVAVAEREGSATLVATTWNVPAPAGAV